jgi:probable DNA metabolism protein
MSVLSIANGVWSPAVISTGVVPTFRVGHFDEWRSVARRLLDAEMLPEEVAFLESEGRQQALDFGDEHADEQQREALGLRRYAVPKGFLALARTVACHRDATRWALLYRLLWRLTHGEPRLLAADADDDVIRAQAMERQVSRDAQRMKASVRFRQVVRDGETWFVAWHRPSHYVVRMVASFFVERFAAMKWTICTPDVSICWDGNELAFLAGRSREECQRVRIVSGRSASVG